MKTLCNLSLGVLSQIKFYSRMLGHWDFPLGPVTRWPWKFSVASVALDFARPPALPRRPSDPVTLRIVSGLSGPGLSQRPSDPLTPRNVSDLSGLGVCRATRTFPKDQWPGDPEKCQLPQWPGTFPKAKWPSNPEKCQWPLWPGTLPGHRDFPESPVTRWPREMSMASVAREFTGPPGLSQRPSDPVTPRNVSSLSGPGLCRATGTFPKAQWPSNHEKCQWPQWPGTLPGHRDFPEGPVTRWPREMAVASVARDFAGPPGLSPRPSKVPNLTKLMIAVTPSKIMGWKKVVKIRFWLF